MTRGAQEYEKRWLHSEQSVDVLMPEGDSSGARNTHRNAVIKGLSASGFPPSIARQRQRLITRVAQASSRLTCRVSASNSILIARRWT
jgi:hypothetical protein